MRKKQKANNPINDKELILSKETGFHITEAYKATRTNIMFSLSGKGSKAIAVTSSLPEEGKTTTCINLAITFAQTGAKVLIIDSDLRKPTVHKKLGIQHDNGLSHLITGFATLEQVIVPTQWENLDVIMAGHIPPNPAELMASESMDAILQDVQGKYDYIFIDTPPVNVVTDATVLASKVAGTVVVARQDQTQHRELQDAIGKLDFVQAKVLGVILNDVKSKKGRGYAYGKYGKYSKYSYSYAAPEAK